MNNSQFNQLARTHGFKGNALRNGAYTKKYKQYIVTKTKQWSKDGISMEMTQLPPQLPNVIYNPTAKQDRTRFVAKNKVLRKDGKVRAKFQDLINPEKQIYSENLKYVALDPYKSLVLPKVKKFYQKKEKGSSVIVDLLRMDLEKDFVKIINSLPAGDEIVLSHHDSQADAQETFLTLNDNNKLAIIKRIRDSMFSEVSTADSIGAVIETILEFRKVKLQYRNTDYMFIDDDAPLPFPVPTLTKQQKQKKKAGAKKGKKKNDGGFFPYTAENIPEELYRQMHLKEAGVFCKVEKHNYRFNCLVSALSQSSKSLSESAAQDAVSKAAVSMREIQKVHTMVFTQYVPNKDIPKIANMLKRKIYLWNDDCHKQHIQYGSEFKGDPIKLACLKRHYFANDKIPITNYAIENYESVKHLDNWFRVTAYEPEKGKGARKVTAKDWDNQVKWTTKFKALKWLLENKMEYFSKIHYSTNLMATAFHERGDIVRDFETLEYVKSDLRGVTEPYIAYSNEKEPKSDKERLLEKQMKGDTYMNFYLDFETFTKGVKCHTPFLACAEAEDGHQFTFWKRTEKTNLGSKVIGAIAKYAASKNKHPRVFAHNMRYDFRFIVNEINRLQTIEPNGRFVVAWGNVGGTIEESVINPKTGKTEKRNVDMKIQIRDSYTMISEPLRNFGKLFPNISTEKDVMPYNAYTPDNYEKGSISVEECLTHLNPKEHTQFLENLKKPNMVNEEGLVNLKEYAVYYCRKDVTVLREGWNTFRDQIAKLTIEMPQCPVAIDINLCNTSAKLAHTIMMLSGVYDEVYQTSGVVQAFLARGKVGGRTMTGRNQKHLVKDRTIGNSDANSLYPSAMARLDGYLKGKPKVIDPEKHSLEWLSQQSGYVVEVKVKSVRKRLNFPLQSKKVRGIRNFTNNLNGANLTMDNIALEDFMEYHNVKPEHMQIIRGYYYDEGHNDTICNVIKYLYAERRKYKKMRNPIEKSYKLILNSAYGYSILKPVDSEIVIKHKKELEKYVSTWFNYIKSYTMSQDGRYARIEQLKTIDDHYNLAIAGIQVLSMSKRIMNEVMCLAEDLNIDMYYQDTDSIHLEGSKLDLLEKAYEDKYSDKPWFKPLYGKELGQFSSDFEMDGIDEDKIKCTNAVYLGKKCYIECLEGTDDEGKTHHDAHLRMKGVSNGAILWRCKELSESPLELYSRLYKKGKGEEFDLLKCEDGWEKCNFKFHANYTITNNASFRRFVTFDDDLRKERKQK